jgi:hypothetical protein
VRVRVSVRAKKLGQRRRKLELGFVQGPLYGEGARLVTPSGEEKPPATPQAEHGFVLSTMQGKEDEDEPLLDI